MDHLRSNNSSSAFVIKRPRFPLVDVLRGFAVALMIFFHCCYDLKILNMIDFNMDRGGPWWMLPRIIVFLFMIAAGMSLRLQHHPAFQTTVFFKRLSLLVFWAVVISISTYFLFPTTWIYFGTLHSIALCSLLTLPFIARPKIAGGLGGLIILFTVIFKVKIPWILLKHYSMDYIPPFPWVGYMLIGIFLTHQGVHTWGRWDHLWGKFFINFFGRMGKHSLFIYIVHQPILYGALLLIRNILQ